MMKFSIDLAKAINGEIINADSMQMYKGLEQITNKHPVDERKGIDHHVMNHINWNEEYHIHRFAEEATRKIEDIHSRGKVPIVIGGTHYYLLSLLFNNKTMNKETELRELTPEEIQLLDGPVEPIFEELKKLDPVIAEKFHPQDKRKLRRALEIYYTTNKRTSDLYKEQKMDELEDSSLKFNTLVFWVYSDPEILRARLDARVDKMMDSGAITEIRELYEHYCSESPKPDLTTGIWQVIGFKEFLPWLESNKEEDFKDGVEKMKIRTRQYAKSQVKWIKKLLATELNKEARFNFKYGGKIYLLDATDLTNWEANVFSIGESITGQFLAGGPKLVTYPQTPSHIDSSIFPTEEFLSTVKSNKNLGAETDWKHFECQVCVDKNGNPLVAIGKDKFDEHLKSRRHTRKVGANERKRKHMEVLLANKRPQEVVEVKKSDVDENPSSKE